MRNFKPIREMLGDTWKDFEQNWQNYVGISAIFIGATFVIILIIIFGFLLLQFAGIFSSIPFLTGNSKNFIGGVLILFLILSFLFIFLLIFFMVFVINSWLMDSLISSIGKIYPYEKNITAIIKLSWPKVWRTFFAIILISFIVLVGFIFLIIPGIIFGLMLSQVLFLIIIENLKIGQAFQKSYQLTKGYLWIIFLYNLAAIIIAEAVIFFLTIIPIIGSLGAIFITIIMTPLLTIFQYQIYSELKKVK